MSDLYRSAISARLAKLPAVPPAVYPAQEEGTEDEEADGLGDLPGGMGPPAMPSRARKRTVRAPNPAFAAISASGYFEQAIQVAVPSTGLDMRVYYTPSRISTGAIMVCHHGAGYSGVSFACFAKEVTDMAHGECGVLAFDARRHGKTIGSESDENLSIEVLTHDFVELLQTVFPNPLETPLMILVGHSMGGSVVVRACPLLQGYRYRVSGVAVLDVVEGSAIDALPFMNNLLNARPEGFDSPEHAIEWHVTTNAIHNVSSARVSVPAIIRPSEGGPLPYTWRTPLRSTAPYWTSWFTGLSERFLAVRTARLLVLAGTDRLDRPLMIGQMQGKFQMVVIPGPAVGHMVHEDDPTRVADILIEFWRRNERVVAGVKKVGDV